MGAAVELMMGVNAGEGLPGVNTKTPGMGPGVFFVPGKLVLRCGRLLDNPFTETNRASVIIDLLR